MTTQAYKVTDREAPKDGQKVYWLTSDGQEVEGVYYKRLWFLGDDMGMYVYYVPKFWRERTVRE